MSSLYEAQSFASEQNFSPHEVDWSTVQRQTPLVLLFTTTKIVCAPSCRGDGRRPRFGGGVGGGGGGGGVRGGCGGGCGE